MEQNKNPRNKLTNTQSINLWQRGQEYIMGVRTVPSISGVGKTGQPHAKE